LGLVGLGKAECVIDQIDDTLGKQPQLGQCARRIIEGIVLGEPAQRCKVAARIAQEFESS
jgi:hypothetical protein